MTRLLLTASQTDRGNNASSKPRDDIEYFLEQAGYKTMHLGINIQSKIHKAIFRYWVLNHRVARELTETDPDEIFIQYPIYSDVIMDQLLKVINNLPKRQASKCRIYLIIHDAESLRLYRDKPEFAIHEVDRFNQFDGLIVHNQAMLDWLTNAGVKTPMTNLQFFDYRNPQPMIKHDNNDQEICFAGNLSKSKFLNELNWDQLKLHVYGSGLKINNPSLIAEGSKTPEELPKFLHYKFGLVWDGESAATCTGEFGDYLKYNAPHKASLYLSSGLPLVVWSKSALAPVIDQLNLGLTIDNLNDLEPRLLNLSEEDYSTMVKNVQVIGNDIRKGQMIITAADQISEMTLR